MEIRTLRYFLETAREGNMTRAAERLAVTQSTLSKQLKGLEEELGKKLFIRHSFSIELTEEAMLLRKHAEDLLTMADKITEEFKSLDDILGGDIYFGCAESFQICYLARMIRLCREQYPGLRYHITSGDTEQVAEKLDKGLLDFGIIVEEPNREKYHVLTFPEADRWTLVMPEHCALAQKEKIEFEDLLGLPLFCSEQSVRNDLPRWCGERVRELKFEGSFRLSYNGSVFAREGLGYLLTFDKLIDTSPGSGLTARPLSPLLETPMYLIWRKYQVFTPIAERFLSIARQEFERIGKAGKEEKIKEVARHDIRSA